jgi:hypothetical protein
MSIAAGITVGLIASLVQSLGMTIQRKSHILNDQLPIEEQRVERRRPSVDLLLQVSTRPFKLNVPVAGYGCWDSPFSSPPTSLGLYFR